MLFAANRDKSTIVRWATYCRQSIVTLFVTHREKVLFSDNHNITCISYRSAQPTDKLCFHSTPRPFAPPFTGACPRCARISPGGPGAGWLLLVRTVIEVGVSAVVANCAIPEVRPACTRRGLHRDVVTSAFWTISLLHGTTSQCILALRLSILVRIEGEGVPFVCEFCLIRSYYSTIARQVVSFDGTPGCVYNGSAPRASRGVIFCL